MGCSAENGITPNVPPKLPKIVSKAFIIGICYLKYLTYQHTVVSISYGHVTDNVT